MPIADRFVHDLAIVTPTTTGALDERGQPVAGTPTTTLVSGLVQPRPAARSAREVMLTSQAGAEIADHVVYLAIDVTVRPASYVRFEPDNGDRYEVVGIREYNFGRDPHLEVDTRRIVSPVLAAEGS